MAQSLVAVGGKYKNNGSIYVAVGGKWKRVNTAYEAVGGKWKAAYSGVPQGTVNLTLAGNASWSRIVASATARGTWTALRLVMQRTNLSTAEFTINTWGAVIESNVTLNPTETIQLTPNTAYTAKLIADTSSGQTVTIAQASLSTSAPPVVTSFGLHGSGPYSGGVYWTAPRDISEWNNVNDSLGTSWNQGATDTQIWYGSGLSPNTRYYVRTRALSNGVYGGYSPQQSFVTAPPAYTAGEYYVNPNGNSQTYQSGGSQGTSWQGSSRTWWYHGNGAAWSSTRGRQRTMIYYDINGGECNAIRNAINNGASVTGTAVYVHRANENSGNNGGVAALVGLNGNWFQGAPNNISGNAGGPALNKGYGAWVGVPAHWGYHIVMQNVTASGWILGDSDDQNHYMALGKGNYNTGLMRITLA